MQHVSVTPLYAAALSALFIALSMRVIAARHASGVAIGVGGHGDLERRARVHANFAEYVPLALLLMLMVEAAGHGRWLCHALGASLVAGRLLHAAGVSQKRENYSLRISGMTLTFGVIGVAACSLIIASF